MERAPLVSVCIITYNHERFVRQCLESILSQKTNFKFEVLIHDDASPDNTAAIIREYETKYPDVIRVVCQSENQYSKGISVTQTYLVPLIRGKYMAFCEGDDYYTDEFKLQKMVDYLERHPEVCAVAHRHEIVDINGRHMAWSHEGENLDRFFGKDDVLRLRQATLHPNAVMIRAKVRKSDDYFAGTSKCCVFEGHTFLIFYLANQSPIYIMSDCMSAWRNVVEKGGTSFQSKYKGHIITYGMAIIDMYFRYREFFGEAYKFDSIIADALITQLINCMTESEDGVDRLTAIIDTLRIASAKEFKEAFNKLIEKESSFSPISILLDRVKKQIGMHPLVLYGPARNCVGIYDLCTKRGLEVSAVCNRGAKGTVHGIQAINPQTLCKNFRSAFIVICAGIYTKEIHAELLRNGYVEQQIFSFEGPCHIHLLPQICAHIDGYVWAYDFFEDECSKKTVLERLCWWFNENSMMRTMEVDRVCEDEFIMLKDKDALIGVKKLIKQEKPKIAICAGHKIEDVYKIPQIVLSIRDDYKFCLRQHMDKKYGLVLYAV